MGFDLWKKIKDAFKKVGTWVKDKIIMPVVNFGKRILQSDTVKSIVDTGMKLAPMIGGAVAASQGAPPQAGMAIGSAVQGIGRTLGYG